LAPLMLPALLGGCVDQNELTVLTPFIGL